ncbi:YbhB/YbcL family Raf kinase inhibitor-like protein [Hypericibacter adhaerens]|jgi:Raf kinase inhibitor-like YbhB/YbcL family protein|uniref:YbhB/YbcL family Raf kinase inhibitor-like protein n=1 Tax=Hypericibacter adhaerens TaxID=2602016 RepID=UPI001245B0ED|nr:YbhB/YbcL family Raf kinase inhibitor-like protein [Hypericibacter adhaerens]
MIARTIRSALAAFLLLGAGLAATSSLQAADFRVYSHDIKDGQFQPDQVLSAAFGLGCQGGNLSPHINWEGMPQGTQSFALTLFDQDANNGKGWTHWVVVNIPYRVNSLPRGAAGSGAVAAVGALQTLNDFGQAGYGGPCPPPGQTHHYVVTLTALSVAKLPLDKTATPAMAAAAIAGSKIAAVSFAATYER